MEQIFGGRYRVAEKVGAGGMADVYKGVDDVLGRTVAIKVLHARLAADPTFAARFRQEAQSAANLQSPHIVQVYDWGQEGDTYFIVMEFVNGTDLKSIIDRRGALAPRQVADMGAQVCLALTAAAAQSVIHRDIKPHNIMVQPDGVVKVMDFGIARAGNTTMTQTGSVLGTAHYVSPEQAQGRALTPVSDLYSLGIVLYEASTGQLPFDADTPVAVALKQVNESAVAPTSINPAIPSSLEGVIGKAMAKRAEDRYPNAEAMREDLLKIAQGQSVNVVVPPPPDHTAVMPAVQGTAPARRSGQTSARRKKPVWPWVLLLALLLLAGVAVAWQAGLFGAQTKTVPNLVGLSPSAANDAITQAGFVPGEVKSAYRNDVPVNKVAEQSPAAGTEAEEGSKIDLIVSKGKQQVKVPNLVGKDQSDVSAILEKAGLTLRLPTGQDYSSKPVDSVISQSPKAGEMIDAGSAVGIVVSRGQQAVSVPDVVGKPRGTAVANLEEAGFDVTVREEFSDTVGSGDVISQNPTGLAYKGSAVTITVSQGVEPVQVPKVLDQSAASATQELENAGLVVKVIYQPGDTDDMVVKQNPKEGASVMPGSTVTITVSQMTTPPPGTGGTGAGTGNP